MESTEDEAGDQDDGYDGSDDSNGPGSGGSGIGRSGTGRSGTGSVQVVTLE